MVSPAIQGLATLNPHNKCKFLHLVFNIHFRSGINTKAVNLQLFHHMVNSNKINRSNLTESGNLIVVMITSNTIGQDLHPATTYVTPKDTRIGGRETINSVPLVEIVATNSSNSHHQVVITAEMREIDGTREVGQIQVANPARMTMDAAITMITTGDKRGVTMVVEAAITTETITTTTKEISAVIVTVGTTTEKSQN